MSLRKEFVELSNVNGNISELCKRFDISRKTAYKWIQRYHADGADGLIDRSRKPMNSPNKTSAIMEAMIVDIRKKFPWCGRKINGYLINKGIANVPSPSTITSILKRNGCISPAASEKATPWNRFERETPNELWQMDFKGHFPTQQGRCHPLTVLDDHSRYCVCLRACTDEKGETVKGILSNVFRRYGMPLQINVDNGPPWGTERKGEYTRLSLWLIRLGIVMSNSAPYHPQTNGKDERFHRTLKAEVLQGRVFCDVESTQLIFDEWRPVYNFQRPHDALGNKAPGTRYKASQYTFPEVLPPIEYCPDDIVRKVENDAGKVSFKGYRIRISGAFKSQYVAFRPTTTDGVYHIYYVRQKIKTIDLRNLIK